MWCRGRLCAAADASVLEALLPRGIRLPPEGEGETSPPVGKSAGPVVTRTTFRGVLVTLQHSVLIAISRKEFATRLWITLRRRPCATITNRLMAIERNILGLTALCGIGAMVLGCSSPPEVGKCPGFSACGGVLTGIWDATSFCVDGDPEKPKNAALGMPECRNFYASVSFEHVVSTLDFTGSDTIAGSINYWSTSEVELTSDCSLALYTTEVTPEICVELTEDLKGSGWEESLVCSGTSVCYCNGQAEHAGATILIDEQAQIVGAGGERLEYCVSGDMLTVTDSSQGVDVFVTYRRRAD